MSEHLIYHVGMQVNHGRHVASVYLFQWKSRSALLEREVPKRSGGRLKLRIFRTTTLPITKIALVDISQLHLVVRVDMSPLTSLRHESHIYILKYIVLGERMVHIFNKNMNTAFQNKTGHS